MLLNSRHMDYRIILISLGISHYICLIAWGGGLVFIPSVASRVISSLSGESRVNAGEKMYKLTTIYVRVWGLLTVVLGITFYLMPVAPAMVMLSRLDNWRILIPVLVSLVAYIGGVEGLTALQARRYTSITAAMDQKMRGRDVAHLLVLEKKVSVATSVQLALVILLAASTYYLTVF